MEPKVNLHSIDNEVRRIKSAAEKLESMGDVFPAVSRNSVRILASVKMLELNISDYLSLETDER